MRSASCSEANSSTQTPSFCPERELTTGRRSPWTGTFTGAGVNLAARVAGQARGGELLVTEEAAMAARDAGAMVTHVGAIELRNIPAPVDIYRVQITDTTSETAVDPVCHMRVPIDGPSAVTLEWAGQTVHFCDLPCVARFAAHHDRYPAGRKPAAED